jgi:hypothetical protein
MIFICFTRPSERSMGFNRGVGGDGRRSRRSHDDNERMKSMKG